jgi:hypothetical protein
MVAVLNSKRTLNPPGFDPMTICIQVQYAATELTHIVLQCCGFTLFKEGIENKHIICKIIN